MFVYVHSTDCRCCEEVEVNVRNVDTDGLRYRRSLCPSVSTFKSLHSSTCGSCENSQADVGFEIDICIFV